MSAMPRFQIAASFEAFRESDQLAVFADKGRLVDGTFLTSSDLRVILADLGQWAG